MSRNTLITVAAAFTMTLGAFIHSQTVSAQQESAQATTAGKPPPTTPIYNPYPPGILPSDLVSEIDRVLREVDVIEKRAIERWQSLPPPTRSGLRPGPNPPVLKGTGTELTETLGELMLFDKNMSPNRNQACASCHMPYVAFGPPIPSVNLTMIAYPGTAQYLGGVLAVFVLAEALHVLLRGQL
jgi:cytochrome c peroxidase